MKYRKLGRTDLDVSLICLGTMTWGRQNSEAEGHEQMDYALTRGVNFFDTAEMYAVPTNPDTYGRTEAIIGSWFGTRKNRDKVILATKAVGAGIPWIRDGKARLDRANILEAVEGSLKRLQTDYIDLYQLHWPNRNNYHFDNMWDFEVAETDRAEELENIEDVLDTLQGLIKQGKIRHIGLSNETAWGTQAYLRLAEDKGLPRMASIQNEYSLLKRNFDLDLAEVAQLEDIGLLAWSPLAMGLLTGKYKNGARPEGSRWAIEENRSYRDTPEANKAVDGYHEVAAKHDLDPCQMALAFVNQQPFVTANIIGATTMEQLRSNIDSVNITLNDDVLSDIKKVYRQYPKPY